MRFRVEMPQPAPSMDSGIVATWHKAVGDRVDFGDELCEIHVDEVKRMDRRVSPRAILAGTAKTGYRTSRGGVLVRFVVLMMEPGIVERIVANEGVRVSAGDLLAIIGPGSSGGSQLPLTELPRARVMVERPTTPVGPWS